MYSSSFYFQMKLILLVTACLIAVCLAEPKPAINEVNNNKAAAVKGRFLSLPIPEKCSSSK